MRQNEEYSIYSLITIFNILVCSHAVLVLSISRLYVLHGKNDFVFLGWIAQGLIDTSLLTLKFLCFPERCVQWL